MTMSPQNKRNEIRTTLSLKEDVRFTSQHESTRKPLGRIRDFLRHLGVPRTRPDVGGLKRCLASNHLVADLLGLKGEIVAPWISRN